MKANNLTGKMPVYNKNRKKMNNLVRIIRFLIVIIYQLKKYLVVNRVKWKLRLNMAKESDGLSMLLMLEITRIPN